MSTELPPSGMDEMEWMSRLKRPTEELVKALDALNLPADLRPVAFDRMFEVVLARVRAEAHDSRPLLPATVLLPANAPWPRFEKFLKDYSVSMDALAHVIDFDSGHVLARNLGTTKAEGQRKLAALLCLASAQKTGEFTVTRDQLVAECKDHGVFDLANFASNMGGVEFNGFGVFTREGNIFKVSRPGEAFVADVVKGLLPAAP